MTDQLFIVLLIILNMLSISSLLVLWLNAKYGQTTKDHERQNDLLVGNDIGKESKDDIQDGIVVGSKISVKRKVKRS